jgi:hypothetical protein
MIAFNPLRFDLDQESYLIVYPLQMSTFSSPVDPIVVQAVAGSNPVVHLKSRRRLRML